MASSTPQSLAVTRYQKCQLLNIPFEIREKIFTLAVIAEAANVVYPYERNGLLKTTFTYTAANFFRTDGDHEPEPLTTALILGLTCHQLYDEVVASNLFYRVNKFLFYGSYPLTRYLKSVVPLRMNSITRIVLEVPQGNDPTQAFNTLSACKGLKDLVLVLHSTIRQGTAAYNALCRIRGLEHVKIINLFHMSPDAAIMLTEHHARLAEAQRVFKARNQFKEGLERTDMWGMFMDIGRLITQDRTKKSDRRGDAAAAISCYCPQPRILRFGRGNKCRCQERTHVKFSAIKIFRTAVVFDLYQDPTQNWVDVEFSI